MTENTLNGQRKNPVLSPDLSSGYETGFGYGIVFENHTMCTRFGLGIEVGILKLGISGFFTSIVWV